MNYFSLHQHVGKNSHSAVDRTEEDGVEYITTDHWTVHAHELPIHLQVKYNHMLHSTTCYNVGNKDFFSLEKQDCRSVNSDILE